VQRLVARDRTVPALEQPADRVLSEEPENSGQAKVEFAVPGATDTCDPAPVVECVPPSGSFLPLGNTRVLCVARDAAGNTNLVSFQVRVVPRKIVVDNLADSGPGTLRDALQDANTAP